MTDISLEIFLHEIHGTEDMDIVEIRLFIVICQMQLRLAL